MEKGSYNGRRVDFRAYTASGFKPHFFTRPFDARIGCGATALALLTGLNPRYIAAENGSAHYSDKFMVGFLRRWGYAVQPLTLCNLSASDSQIEPEHVVLLSQLYCRNEATWGVLFKGVYYHNFGLYKFDTLSLLNKPLLSAYLIIEPSWRSPRGSVPMPAAAKPRRKKSQNVRNDKR